MKGKSFMTWEECENEIEKLSTKIDITPDIVIGIVKGGIIPARLLSRNLEVKDMYCLTVKKIGEDRKVTTDIVENISGKDILLVEDMLETGKSLIVAKKYLEGKGVRVTTTCLYTMPITQIKPDYFLKEVTEVKVFPWE